MILIFDSYLLRYFFCKIRKNMLPVNRCPICGNIITIMHFVMSTIFKKISILDIYYYIKWKIKIKKPLSWLLRDCNIMLKYKIFGSISANNFLFLCSIPSLILCIKSHNYNVFSELLLQHLLIFIVISR